MERVAGMGEDVARSVFCGVIREVMGLFVLSYGTKTRIVDEVYFMGACRSCSISLGMFENKEWRRLDTQLRFDTLPRVFPKICHLYQSIEYHLRSPVESPS